MNVSSDPVAPLAVATAASNSGSNDDGDEKEEDDVVDFVVPCALFVDRLLLSPINYLYAPDFMMRISLVPSDFTSKHRFHFFDDRWFSMQGFDQIQRHKCRSQRLQLSIECGGP
jgi:hypothetical protein